MVKVIKNPEIWMITSEKNLWGACRDIRRNGGGEKDSEGRRLGTPGPDGQTVGGFGSDPENLARLRMEMITGIYRPDRYRETAIDKGNGKKRILGISNVRDRVAMRGFTRVIAPYFEHTFLFCSHGFREYRDQTGQKLSCITALVALKSAIESEYPFIIVSDISNAFGSTPHSLTMQNLNTHIQDPAVISLAELFLKQESITSRKADPQVGFPQGSPCSPLFMNLAMHYLDVFITEAGFLLIRYADDFVVCCRTRKDAVLAQKFIRSWCEDNDLSLKSDKEGKSWIPIDARKTDLFFLGLQVRAGRPMTPTPQKMEVIKRRIIEKTRRYRGTAAIPKLIRETNDSLTAWHNYYGKLCPEHVFEPLDTWVRSHLGQMIRAAGRRRRRSTTPPTNKEWAARGLVTLSRKYSGRRPLSAPVACTYPWDTENAE